jgi:hypothetical protein
MGDFKLGLMNYKAWDFISRNCVKQIRKVRRINDYSVTSALWVDKLMIGLITKLKTII